MKRVIAMIERFSLTADIGDIVEMFQVRKVIYGHTNRFNVAPTQTVSIVMNDRFDQRTLQESRWGLFPFWAKDAINADHTTLSEKPFWRECCVDKDACCHAAVFWTKAVRERA